MCQRLLERREGIHCIDTEMLGYAEHRRRTSSTVKSCYHRHRTLYGTFDEYGTVLREWVDDVETAWHEHGDERRVVELFQSRHHLYYREWNDPAADEAIRMNVEGVLRYVRNREV